MRCLECGAEFDELNESQPVCPACGAPPGLGRDDQDDAVRMPLDLQEARDDAESLLLATGHATFDLPEGFRMFPLPTERIM